MSNPAPGRCGEALVGGSPPFLQNGGGVADELRVGRLGQSHVRRDVGGLAEAGPHVERQHEDANVLRSVELRAPQEDLEGLGDEQRTAGLEGGRVQHEFDVRRVDVRLRGEPERCVTLGDLLRDTRQLFLVDPKENAVTADVLGNTHVFP